MERALCRRCLQLKRILPACLPKKGVQGISSTSIATSPSTLLPDSNVVNRLHHRTGSIMSTTLRHYATKERSTDKVYKYGKLVVEEVEDETLYKNFLIILTSHDQVVLDGFQHFVKKAAKMIDLDVSQSFNMPAIEETYKAKISGKGSAHIEYKLKQHRRVVEITELTAERCDIFMDYVQRALPSGVNIEVQLIDWERYVDPTHVKFKKDM